MPSMHCTEYKDVWGRRGINSSNVSIVRQIISFLSEVALLVHVGLHNPTQFPTRPHSNEHWMLMNFDPSAGTALTANMILLRILIPQILNLRRLVVISLSPINSLRTSSDVRRLRRSKKFSAGTSWRAEQTNTSSRGAIRGRRLCLHSPFLRFI